jgi:hypothetical protein
MDARVKPAHDNDKKDTDCQVELAMTILPAEARAAKTLS